MDDTSLKDISDINDVLDQPCDQSFLSVNDSQDDYSKENAASAVTNKTVYEKVKYHDEIGKLVLTTDRIIYAPYDGGSPTRGSIVALSMDGEHAHHHSWRWKAIQKHQITPAHSGKSMMKLVSTDSSDGKKGVTFALRNRDELERIRVDVSQRLGVSNKKETTQLDDDRKSSPGGGSKSSSPSTSCIRAVVATGTSSMDAEPATTVTTDATTSNTTSVAEPESASVVPSLETASESTPLLVNHDVEAAVATTNTTTTPAAATTAATIVPEPPIYRESTHFTGRSHTAVWTGAIIILVILIGIKSLQFFAPAAAVLSWKGSSYHDAIGISTTTTTTVDAARMMRTAAEDRHLATATRSFSSDNHL